jgi:hypothetical protein
MTSRGDPQRLLAKTSKRLLGRQLSFTDEEAREYEQLKDRFAKAKLQSRREKMVRKKIEKCMTEDEKKACNDMEMKICACQNGKAPDWKSLMSIVEHIDKKTGNEHLGDQGNRSKTVQLLYLCGHEQECWVALNEMEFDGRIWRVREANEEHPRTPEEVLLDAHEQIVPIETEPVFWMSEGEAPQPPALAKNSRLLLGVPVKLTWDEFRQWECNKQSGRDRLVEHKILGARTERQVAACREMKERLRRFLGGSEPRWDFLRSIVNYIDRESGHEKLGHVGNRNMELQLLYLALHSEECDLALTLR